MEDIEKIKEENSNNLIIVSEDSLNNCLVGFSDEEYPREVFPPYIKHYDIQYTIRDSTQNNVDIFKKKSLFTEQEIKEFVNNPNFKDFKYKERNTTCPFDEYGIIQNWDDINLIWEDIFTKKLKVSPEKYNIILTEGINNTKEKRGKMAEIMFETFNISNLFIAKKLVLPLFSEITTSGFMIDFGKDIITTAPIFEGFCLPFIESFDIPSHSPFFQPNIVENCSKSIGRFDRDIQKKLTGCIYLYGIPSRIERISEQISHKFYYMYGDSKNQGISEQFTRIIQGLFPSCYEYVKVVILPEKRLPMWEGALCLSNILSKSDWISKVDYEEMGSVIVNRKCF